MIEPDLRKLILDRPERLLDDRDLMNALVAANERKFGSNVVDLRAIAMQRLETRLDKLEDTHRSVIAAAYENLAGTHQIHRAILELLEPPTLLAFVTALGDEVSRTLRIDALQLVVELPTDGKVDPALRQFNDHLQISPHGFVTQYMTNGKARTTKPVVLRHLPVLAAAVYGTKASTLRSEALMKLDLGPGRPAAMLAFGATDPNMFKTLQRTDLLAFFAGVFERVVRRWLR